MARTTIREEDITSGAVPTTGIVGTSVFTASGTWTKATREAELGVTIKKINITVIGGGGGGGKGHNTAGYGATGGQAGGAAIKYVYDVSGISSATITVGSAGAGGSSPSAGGTSSYSDGTLTISCPGGAAGFSYTGQQTSNGVPTGGDIIIEGALGYMDSVTYEGGAGGSTILSGGGAAKYNGVGQAATGYGGGGGGAGNSNGNGGAGAPGIVIVTEIAG